MDHVRFQNHFRAEGRRLAEAAAEDLRAPVPSCPGWTVADLVRHSTDVFQETAGRLSARPAGLPPAGPGGDALIDRYVQHHATLYAEFQRQGPEDPDIPGTEPSRSYWFRRMALEAAVHRFDAEQAVGDPAPIDPALALEGIDEALRVLLPRRYDGSADDPATGRTVAVNCLHHHWRVTLLHGEASIDREPGFADAGITGDPTDLLLYLWGRRPGTVVSRTGDHMVLAAFRHRLAAAMR